MADEIILYNSEDGKSHVSLMTRDGMVWLNQSQMAELFATSKQTISYHIDNILSDRELHHEAVVKDYLTTAAEGKTETVYHNLFLAQQHRSHSILQRIPHPEQSGVTEQPAVRRDGSGRV